MLRHKSPHTSELQNSHKKTLFKKDTYRPQFCKPEFYLINLEVFKLWHSLFSQLCLEQQAQAWIIGMCLLRRPQDWFSGKYPEALVDQSRAPISNESFKHPILLHQLCHGTPIQIPQQLNSEMDIIDLINRYRIKPLPLACQRALSHWAYEIYNIKVVPNIPTPTEVLNFQIQGARILSFKSDFKNDFKNWALFKCNDRDYLSFMLHDLVHADHFFYQNNQLRGQIGFYICMQSILTTSELIQLLKNSEFQEQFEYLISDMNAHPVHLFKTLQAQVSQKIPDPVQINKIWNFWINQWVELIDFDRESHLMHHDIYTSSIKKNLNASEKLERNDKVLNLFAALQNINKASFSNRDAIEVEKFAIALGHNMGLD